MLLLLLTCTTDPEPVAPTGSIGGEPILAQPVVLGGISANAVDQTISALDIAGCHIAGTGKVLVQFTIARDGAVSNAKTLSTSLRDPTAESCVVNRIAAAQFPALELGQKAIVKYPFVF